MTQLYYNIGKHLEFKQKSYSSETKYRKKHNKTDFENCIIKTKIL